MSILLHDVVQPYLAGLQQIENFCQAGIQEGQNADKTLGQRRASLLDYQVSFSGLGAMAFNNSVDQDLLRSQHLLTKLDNVREASNHSRRMIESATNDSDTALQVPAPFYNEGFIDRYGYVFMQVQSRLRDDTLSGIILDSILDPKSDVLQYWLDVTKQQINAELQSKSDHNVQLIQERPIINGDVVAANQQKQDITQEHANLANAEFEVDQISKYVSTQFETWRTNLQALTAGYIQSLLAAANMNAVSTGEIIHQLTQSGASIMITRTADGGLIVAVNKFNNGKSDAENAKLVEYAINQYIQENGLQGTTHVTVVGYHDGGGVAQQVATDVGSNPNGYPYQINNEVLVGATLTGTPQHNTEYDAYTFAGDLSDSGGWAPLFKPDPLGLASSLVPLGATTPVSLAAGYVAGVGENVLNRQNNAVDTQLESMDPSHTYSVDPRSVDHIQLLPNEVDAHSGGIFGSSNYDQGTYLNEVSVPDPVATSQGLPIDNVKRVPVTGADSAPTYYYVNQGGPPNSSVTPISGNAYYQ